MKSATAWLMVWMGTLGVLTATESEQDLSPVEAAGLFVRQAQDYYERAHTDHRVAVQAAANAFAQHAETQRILLETLASADVNAVKLAQKEWDNARERCQRVLEHMAAIHEALERAKTKAAEAERFRAQAVEEVDSDRKRRKAVKRAEHACEEAREAWQEVEQLTATLKKQWLIPDYGTDRSDEGKEEPDSQESTLEES